MHFIDANILTQYFTCYNLVVCKNIILNIKTMPSKCFASSYD